MLELSERQQNILNIILEEYVRTGKPVGSIVVSKKINNLSPSTIRNEMNYLEKQGYVHTENSLGRIPQDVILLNYLNEKIIKFNGLNFFQVKEYCSKNNLAFFKKNKIEKEKITTVFLYLINEKKVLLTIVLESETIYNKILVLNEDINQLELLKINESLKKILQNNLLKKLTDDMCLKKYENKKEYVILKKIINSEIYKDIVEEMIIVHGFNKNKIESYTLQNSFEVKIEDNTILFLYEDNNSVYGFKTKLQIEEILWRKYYW